MEKSEDGPERGEAGQSKAWTYRLLIAGCAAMAIILFAVACCGLKS